MGAVFLLNKSMLTLFAKAYSFESILKLNVSSVSAVKLPKSRCKIVLSDDN
jgi:hypothetical protein